jgi:hypothetical protein
MSGLVQAIALDRQPHQQNLSPQAQLSFGNPTPLVTKALQLFI